MDMRGKGAHELQHHADAMTINIWQATISFPCITIMGKSIIGMISYYMMQMSHIREAKGERFLVQLLWAKKVLKELGGKSYS